MKRIATPAPQTLQNRAAMVLGSMLCVLMALILTPRAFAQEAPDVLIKRAISEVTSAIDADRDIRAGNRQKITALITVKVLPYLDVQSMTRSALGRHWTRATPEQQQGLVREFSRLLINTYSGALANYRPETVIEYRPQRVQTTDKEAVVRSLIRAPGSEPMQLDYYLELISGAWKVTDMNVLGARLVETYKNQFNGAVAADGIDGLIKALTNRNQQIEARSKS